MSVKSNAEKEQNKKDNVIVRIVKSITIEPAVFLVSLSTTIENIANSQIAIDKTCEVEFEYNQTVCDNLVTDYKDENEIIQENVAQFSVYKTLIRYGNTGCRVFKRGVQNWKDFCLKINIPKGNY